MRTIPHKLSFIFNNIFYIKCIKYENGIISKHVILFYLGGNYEL